MIDFSDSTLSLYEEQRKTHSAWLITFQKKKKKRKKKKKNQEREKRKTTTLFNTVLQNTLERGITSHFEKGIDVQIQKQKEIG